MNSPTFNAYQILPVFEDDRGTCTPVLTIEDAEARAGECEGSAFWGIYGQLPDGSVEHIADRGSFEHCAELVGYITGVIPQPS